MIRRAGREWRAKAQSWLSEAKEAAGDTKARAQIAKQQEEIDELKALLKDALKKQNTQGYDKPKGRRVASEPTVDVQEDGGDLRL